MATKHYPLPEAIDPGEWAIAPSPFGGAYVNVETRQMYVNLSADPQWANVRAHEQAHVAFSPPVPKTLPEGVSALTLQAVEDLRVNTLAARAGVNFSAGAPSHLIESAILAATDNPKLAILLSIAVFPTERANVVTRISERQAKKAEATTIQSVVHSAVTFIDSRPTFAETVKVARWIDAQIVNMEAARKRADKLEERYESTERSDKYKGASKPAWKDELDDDTKARLASIAKWESKPAKGMRKGRADGKYFGDLYIETPWLDKKALRPKVTRTYDEGSILRAPWRVTTDQRIFRKDRIGPKRVTILIDASGSMHLTAAAIQAIVEKAPASVVAAYAGDASDNTGILRVLARDGRMSGRAKDFDFPRSNIVDVPALKWLAGQPAPRYLVCDGGFSGLDDDCDADVTDDCYAIMAGAKVTQVRSLTDFNKLLQKKGGKL